MTTTTIYFATNRKPNNRTKPTDFTNEIVGDVDSIRFGTASLTGDALYEADVNALAKDMTITVEPETLSTKNALLSKLGSTQTFTDIAADMREGADALFYIHGYNYTFRESVARTIQLKQWFADRPMAVMMFAWPSEGQGPSIQTYKDDRAMAEASGSAIARAILKAADFIRATRQPERCNRRIHLLAHSMGAWALRGAIQRMRTYVGSNIPPVFNEVMIAAGDEDNDALEVGYKLMPILRGCQRLTVYYNEQDAALKASDVAIGNPDRLGRSGPGDKPDLPPKVACVNASAAIIGPYVEGTPDWQRDDTGHQYYRSNPKVRTDILQVMDGKSDRDIDGRTPRGDYWRLG